MLFNWTSSGLDKIEPTPTTESVSVSIDQYISPAAPPPPACYSALCRVLPAPVQLCRMAPLPVESSPVSRGDTDYQLEASSTGMDGGGMAAISAPEASNGRGYSVPRGGWIPHLPGVLFDLMEIIRYQEDPVCRENKKKSKISDKLIP